MAKFIARDDQQLPPDWRATAIANYGKAPQADAVEHPAHYTSHPSGVECITVTEHMSFLRGNAMKYLWRAGEKGDALTDLRKARWYLDREIANLQARASGGVLPAGPLVDREALRRSLEAPSSSSSP
jgi:uncharacterized protein DUF3310